MEPPVPREAVALRTDLTARLACRDQKACPSISRPRGNMRSYLADSCAVAGGAIALPVVAAIVPGAALLSAEMAVAHQNTGIPSLARSPVRYPCQGYSSGLEAACVCLARRSPRLPVVDRVDGAAAVVETAHVRVGVVSTAPVVHRVVAPVPPGVTAAVQQWTNAVLPLSPHLVDHIASHNTLAGRPSAVQAEAVAVLRFPRCSLLIRKLNIQ